MQMTLVYFAGETANHNQIAIFIGVSEFRLARRATKGQ
jgi:hypothetical protein